MSLVRRLLVATVLLLAAIFAIASGGPVWVVLVVALAAVALALTLILGPGFVRKRSNRSPPTLRERIRADLRARLRTEALELRVAYNNADRLPNESGRTRALAQARYRIEKWGEVTRSATALSYPEVSQTLAHDSSSSLRRLDDLIEYLQTMAKPDAGPEV